MKSMGTKLKLSKPYSIEELYSLIKNETFEAGQPAMENHGPTKWIVFPKLNRNNQVVIGGTSGKFYVQRCVQPVETEYASGSTFLSRLSGRLADFSAASGKTETRCEQLAKSTARQINDMNL